MSCADSDIRKAASSLCAPIKTRYKKGWIKQYEKEGRLIAKGFARDNELGVVVWNPTDKPASFIVKAAKGRLAAAAEPGRERVEPFEPLAPQSLRLLVWKTRMEGEKGKQ